MYNLHGGGDRLNKGLNGSVLQKIRDRQLAAPMDSENLQALVVNELKTKKHTAAEGLLWLVRYENSICIRKIASVIENKVLMIA